MSQKYYQQYLQHSATHSKPAQLDTLIQNGQPTFGVFSQVKRLNYLDYHSPLISQKPLSRWRKDIKSNQFCFIQIVESPFRVCLALATIKIATSAFVYIYNEETEQLEVGEALQPLMRRSDFKGDHYQGQMSFSHSKLSLTLDFTPEQVSIELDSSYLAINAHFERQQQPLAICTPTGRRGWTFTQKEPLSALNGEITIKAGAKMTANIQAQTIELTKTTRANLDWTLGYMRHETNWFWTCINSYLPDGRHFLLNLSMGVNETGMSENACWLDGEIVYLPPVIFKRKDSQASAKDTDTAAHDPWHIYHRNLGWSNVDIDLTFTPVKAYKKTDNFGMVASIFEQWLGEYSGEIRIGEEIIKLVQVIGLAEDHFAKW